MKWIKRKIRNWLNEPCKDEMPKGIGIVSSVREDSRPDTDPVLNFRIYSAENGQILEFNRYDRVKDRHQTSMYIISKDEDVAEKVSKCVTLETMK